MLHAYLEFMLRVLAVNFLHFKMINDKKQMKLQNAFWTLPVSYRLCWTARS